MKALFNVSVTSPALIQAAVGLTPLTVGRHVVHWELDANRNLKSVRFELCGLSIPQDAQGTFQSSAPHVMAEGYQLARLVADTILYQTGLDPFDPGSLLLGSPAIEGETDQERKALAQNKRTVGVSIRARSRVVRRLNSQKIASVVAHSRPLANFADALRTENPVLKYEQLYKVIEHSFTERNTRNNPALDRAVAAHAVQFDPQFDFTQVGKLRDVRNRCVHPRKPGHINPSDLSGLSDLRDALPTMQKLAVLLIEHPP